MVKPFLFFFYTMYAFKFYLSWKKKDKYSLWQSQINGWVQKCREQAAEEDVGSTGHRRAACMCQWKYMLTTLWLQAWNVVAASFHTDFHNADCICCPRSVGIWKRLIICRSSGNGHICCWNHHMYNHSRRLVEGGSHGRSPSRAVPIRCTIRRWGSQTARAKCAGMSW